MIERLLLILGFSLMGLIYFIGETTIGLQTTVSWAATFLPGELHIEQVGGKLFSTFYFTNLSYHSKTEDLTIHSFLLDWKPKALFKNIVAINQLNVRDIRIQSNGIATTSAPTLPVNTIKLIEHIVAKHVAISNVTFIQHHATQFTFDDIASSFDGKTLNADMHGQFQQRAMKAHFRVSLEREAFAIQEATVSIANANITASGTVMKAWNVRWAIRVPNVALFVPSYRGALNCTGNILGPRLKPIVNITLPSVAILKNVLPDMSNPQGSLQASLQLEGTVADPRFSSKIDLLNGSMSIPKLGITLHRINLHASGNQTKQFTYTGSLQSAQGTASIKGTTDFTRADLPTDIAVHGVNLQAVNLAEYKITLSPDVTIHIANQNLSVQGKILVPAAEITPKDFSHTVILPDEVIFIGEKKQTTASSLLASMPTMQLAVTLGNKIYVHYQDLNTTLTGKLTITTNPESPPTATGELIAVKGTYHAYGRLLAIQEGRLIYTGGLLNNPGLNIKATHQITAVNLGSTNSFTADQTYNGTQVITLGVQILGTINTPTISLFSVPPDLSQADILSYLLLGMPQSQVSSGNKQAILNALSALNAGSNGPSRFGSITQSLQEHLGLTELNVESVQTFNPTTTNSNQSSITENTSVVVGKNISHNLSVHYSIGLFNPVSILNLRYLLTKHWSVQSETSSIDNGMDLLYSIERD